MAYALPIIEGLQAIRPKINRHDGIRVIVVVPTRELAVQTYELFVKLVKVFFIILIISKNFQIYYCALYEK